MYIFQYRNENEELITKVASAEEIVDAVRLGERSGLHDYQIHSIEGVGFFDYCYVRDIGYYVDEETEETYNVMAICKNGEELEIVSYKEPTAEEFALAQAS